MCNTWLLLPGVISELTWTLCTHGLKPQQKQFYTLLSSGLNLSPLHALPQALRPVQKAMIWVSGYHRVKVYKESDHLRGQLVASLIQCSYFSQVTIRSRDWGWTCSNLTGGREELQPHLSPSDTILILPHACISREQEGTRAQEQEQRDGWAELPLAADGHKQLPHPLPPDRTGRSGLRSGTHTRSAQPAVLPVLHQSVFHCVCWTVSKCLMTFPKRNQTCELEEPEGGSGG